MSLHATENKPELYWMSDIHSGHQRWMHKSFSLNDSTWNYTGHKGQEGQERHWPVGRWPTTVIVKPPKDDLFSSGSDNDKAASPPLIFHLCLQWTLSPISRAGTDIRTETILRLQPLQRGQFKDGFHGSHFRIMSCKMPQTSEQDRLCRTVIFFKKTDQVYHHLCIFPSFLVSWTENEK